MGFLTVACSLVAPPAAPALAFVISLLVGGIHTILELFSSWPLHFFAALVLISLYLIVPWQPRHPPGTKLTALDVGRGSTFVLRTSDGATVLYDCGGGNDKVGRDVIVPYLYHEGVTSLEAVILSHPDADHTCALPDILEHLKVGAVIVSRYFERNKDGREILDLARDRGVPVKCVAPGQRFKVGAAAFEVLAPLTDEVFGRTLSDNDTSLILRVADAGASFLFTGDAEVCETAMLLDSGANLEAAVLVVPHHGGKNPLVPQLMRKSRARFALISGGRNQARIVNDLKPLGVTILQTEAGGAITLHHHEGHFSAKTFLKD
jgi:competence protein ComEC